MAVVVKHDSNIAGPATFDDALLALSRIAAELMLDLSSSEVTWWKDAEVAQGKMTLDANAKNYDTLSPMVHVPYTEDESVMKGSLSSGICNLDVRHPGNLYRSGVSDCDVTYFPGRDHPDLHLRFIEDRRQK